ncbi:MAG: hypothetical protein PHP02_09295 [Eubacteriales bacterium]|nr:hypothetical protein [Eubacteriales bacterium]
MYKVLASFCLYAFKHERSFYLQIIWGDKAARRFINAGEYTGYHEQLAELLMLRMQAGSILCDLGCGIGLIVFALSLKLQQIACVDINGEALEKEAARCGITNITPLQADAAHISGLWDYGLMLFFHGQPLDNIHHYPGLVRRGLFYIVHADPPDPQQDHKPARTKCSSVSTIKAGLKKHNIAYQLWSTPWSMARPLRALKRPLNSRKPTISAPKGRRGGF